MTGTLKIWCPLSIFFLVAIELVKFVWDLNRWRIPNFFNEKLFLLLTLNTMKYPRFYNELLSESFLSSSNTFFIEYIWKYKKKIANCSLYIFDIYWIDKDTKQKLNSPVRFIWKFWWELRLRSQLRDAWYEVDYNQLGGTFWYYKWWKKFLLREIKYLPEM